MVGCEQSTQPLESVYNDVINNLTSSSWTNIQIEDSPDGSINTSSEIWTFYKTGKGSHKVIFQNNKDFFKEDIYYFQWAFTTQNYSVICMDIQKSGLLYWQIVKISSDYLEIIQAINDPVLYPEVEKRYVSYHH